MEMEQVNGGKLVELSLESVLRKAADLEASLRGCTIRAAEGALTREEGRASQLASLPPPPPPPVSSRPELSEQWQTLTAYIVSLEKEVQYYKQLLQDVQLHQNSSNGAVAAGVARHPEVSDLAQGGRFTAEHWRVLMEEEPEYCVLLLAFSHLSLQELCPVALVCRKWYRASRHPRLWRQVVMSEIVVEPQVLFRLAEWCYSTERLVLHGLMPPPAAQDQDLESYIHKTRGSLEPGLKAMMETSKQALTSLTVTECNLMATERILWLASVHSPNLRSLAYCSEEFPPSSESLWSLANGCRHLQHLTLPPVPESPNANWFNDSCLFVIAQAWPGLLSLTIGGNAITPSGLKEIAQRSQKLQFLEVIYGPSLHKEGVKELLCDGNGFHALNTLILNFTPASHLALQLLIERCHSLCTLELHITMSSYFSKIESDTVTNYSKILANIKKLKRHSRGKEVFHLYEH